MYISNFFLEIKTAHLRIMNDIRRVLNTFVYADGRNPLDLPGYVIVEFLDYCGGVIFEGEAYETWLPVYPRTLI